jgi:hypothetical protein
VSAKGRGRRWPLKWASGLVAAEAVAVAGALWLLAAVYGFGTGSGSVIALGGDPLAAVGFGILGFVALAWGVAVVRWLLGRRRHSVLVAVVTEGIWIVVTIPVWGSPPVLGVCMAPVLGVLGLLGLGVRRPPSQSGASQQQE